MKKRNIRTCIIGFAHALDEVNKQLCKSQVIPERNPPDIVFQELGCIKKNCLFHEEEGKYGCRYEYSEFPVPLLYKGLFLVQYPRTVQKAYNKTGIGRRDKPYNTRYYSDIKGGGYSLGDCRAIAGREDQALHCFRRRAHQFRKNNGQLPRFVPIRSRGKCPEGQVIPDKLSHFPNLFRALFHLLPFLKNRKSTRLNSSHMSISYAVFCLKKKKK